MPIMKKTIWQHVTTMSFEGRTSSRVHYLKQSISHTGAITQRACILVRC